MSYESEQDFDDEGYEPLFVEGCCFPGECCMPGFHFTCECFTAEMAEDMEAEYKGS